MPRIHERGQVTLPKALRDEVGLAPGDSVTITRRGQDLVIRRAPSILEFRVSPRRAGGASRSGRSATSADAERSAWARAASSDPINRRDDAD